MKNVEQFIREHVRKILAEKSSSSKQLTVVRGRVGKGDFNRTTKLAGSLADKDPGKLMSKLKLEDFRATGSTLEERVLNFIKQAISGADVMKSAYTGAKLVQGEDGVPFIRVTPAEGLSPRDAVQYIFLALVAAEATEALGEIGKKITSGLDLDGLPGIFFEERIKVEPKSKESETKKAR